VRWNRPGWTRWRPSRSLSSRRLSSAEIELQIGGLGIRSRFVTGSEARCGHECRSSGAATADRRIDSGKMPRRANERFSLVRILQLRLSMTSHNVQVLR
jgi:hypothetical protein